MSRNSVIRQFRYEAESWTRLLEFFRQENVSFKTRLAEIVDASSSNRDLEIAERFQEEFLSQDNIISYLSGELQKQARLLSVEINGDGQLLHSILNEQAKLRKDIKKAQNLFVDVKEKFEQYLGKLYQ